jgi:hypothetical protein
LFLEYSLIVPWTLSSGKVVADAAAAAETVYDKMFHECSLNVP